MSKIRVVKAICQLVVVEEDDDGNLSDAPMGAFEVQSKDLPKLVSEVIPRKLKEHEQARAVVRAAAGRHEDPAPPPPPPGRRPVDGKRGA